MTFAAVAIAGSAVLGAGVSIYEGNKANDIASSQLGISEAIFGEQQGFEGQLQQLIANPSSVTSLPGYSFNFGQGSEAVARQMAASGFQGSGNEAAALTQYGQNYAMNTFNQQAALLSSLAGITSASSPSQAGNAATGANTSASTQFQQLFGQLGLLTGYGTGGNYSAAGSGQAIGATTGYNYTTGTPGVGGFTPFGAAPTS